MKSFVHSQTQTTSIHIIYIYICGIKLYFSFYWFGFFIWKYLIGYCVFTTATTVAPTRAHHTHTRKWHTSEYIAHCWWLYFVTNSKQFSSNMFFLLIPSHTLTKGFCFARPKNWITQSLLFKLPVYFDVYSISTMSVEPTFLLSLFPLIYHTHDGFDVPHQCETTYKCLKCNHIYQISWRIFTIAYQFLIWFDFHTRHFVCSYALNR